MNSRTFYIACSLGRWREHNVLRDVLTAAGHTITHDWTTASPWVHETSHGLVDQYAKDNVESIRRAGELDLQGVLNADVVIMLIPGGSGRGTHVELGATLASGKPVILHGTEAAIWGSHDDDSYTCAFYHLPNVTLDTSAWEDFLERAPSLVSGLPPKAPPVLGLDAMARAAYDNAHRKGFWDKQLGPEDPNVGQRMMEAVAELGDAFEMWRASGDGELPHVDMLLDRHEFHPVHDPERADVSQRLMLMVTEIVEAFRDYEATRDLTTITMDVDGKPGKPGGFPTELADVIIRMGDLAGRHQIPLDEAVARKMAYNLGRPWMHGGKRC